MTEKMPMFPLNTVLFPGVSVPLRVFEDRYRALVHRLLTVAEPADRLFGSVAIREGYEVGDHGSQSLHRIGCYLQLTDAVSHDDGTFDIVAVGRGRIRLDGLDGSGSYLEGTVERLEDIDGPVREETIETALATFETYRTVVSEVSDADVLVGDLPHDATWLSWSLAATCLLTMRQRQNLLEAPNAAVRLALATDMLHAEIRAMRAVPSLPATDVSRTRWSPN
ncbi:MAG TPA: LON peptidase substrate-binding domain-containing protein [Nocardioides sp.]